MKTKIYRFLFLILFLFGSHLYHSCGLLDKKMYEEKSYNEKISNEIEQLMGNSLKDYIKQLEIKVYEQTKIDSVIYIQAYAYLLKDYLTMDESYDELIQNYLVSLNKIIKVNRCIFDVTSYYSRTADYNSRQSILEWYKLSDEDIHYIEQQFNEKYTQEEELMKKDVSGDPESLMSTISIELEESKDYLIRGKDNIVHYESKSGIEDRLLFTISNGRLMMRKGNIVVIQPGKSDTSVLTVILQTHELERMIIGEIAYPVRDK